MNDEVSKESVLMAILESQECRFKRLIAWTVACWGLSVAVFGLVMLAVLKVF